MGGSDPSDLPLTDLLSASDPVAAFAEAERAGALIEVRSSGTTSAHRLRRTPASWSRSFPHVSALAGIDASSRIWIPGPLTSTMNLFHRVHAAWAGATLADRIDGIDGIDGATHAVVTPAVLARVVADRVARVGGVRFVVAGDHLDDRLVREARARGALVEHYYGAAELSFVAWGSDATTLRPFPGVDLDLREGAWWVRSPYLAEGLVSDQDGYVTVGDRGAWVGDTVRVDGRPGAITTAGATVVVSGVERVLRTAADAPIIVVGLPHPDLGQVLGCAATSSEALDRARSAASRLPSPERPRHWLLLDRWPLTGGGKIDRPSVADAFRSRRPSTARGRQP